MATDIDSMCIAMMAKCCILMHFSWIFSRMMISCALQYSTWGVFVFPTGHTSSYFCDNGAQRWLCFVPSEYGHFFAVCIEINAQVNGKRRADILPKWRHRFACAKYVILCALATEYCSMLITYNIHFSRGNENLLLCWNRVILSSKLPNVASYGASSWVRSNLKICFINDVSIYGVKFQFCWFQHYYLIHFITSEYNLYRVIYTRRRKIKICVWDWSLIKQLV